MEAPKTPPRESAQRRTQRASNQTSVPSLPVFISGSSFDYRWRDQIKGTVGAQSGLLIDWWDASRISAGGAWNQEVAAAIRRARVAVILLSPTYLASDVAGSELTQILLERKARALPLLPIVIESCEWQQLEFPKEIQVWAGARPLSILPQNEVEAELAKVVRQVVEWASESAGSPTAQRTQAPAPGPVERAFQKRPKLDFSESATAVLDRARKLADQSRREVVTSSCLLFAFAESAGSLQNTAWFVRQALSRNGAYEEVFKRFLDGGAKTPPGGELEGLPGGFSFNALAILDYAATIASRVRRGSRTIQARDLFASLIVAPGADGTPVARTRLTRQGVNLAELAAKFLEFLSEQAAKDDQAEWSIILAAAMSSETTPQSTPTRTDPEPSPRPKSAPADSTYVVGTPGYTSEFCGVGGAWEVPDHLGVGGLAHRLAELMVLEETKLPLAVGLFGNWGSGKSHFMNLMDRHMKSLCTDSRKAADSPEPGAASESPWCREVVPIYFNAWHYSDSNLWASLVTEVFDALFAHLAPKTDQLETLRSRLRDAGGVTAQAEAEAGDAQKCVEQAEGTLAKARAGQNVARQAVRGLLDGLESLLPELNTRQNRERITDLLGVPAEAATLSTLTAKVKELGSFGGRAKELWRRAVAPEGRAWRFAWLAGILTTAALVRVAAGHVQWIAAALTAIGPRIQPLILGLSAVAAWMIPAFRKVRGVLDQLEKWQKQAEDAQEAARHGDPRVIAAQEALRAAEARASQAEAALAAARSLELRLTQEIAESRPERRLSRFIEARVRSADYRGQLGLVSLARRDFEELSGIFADKAALEHRIKEKPDEAEQLKKLSASVDRVILFIDDLDRCDPEKVVDVLQAVHLLLAYPLFGVVVGVDQRCLKQSLRIRFKGLLTPPPQQGPGQGARTPDQDEIPATPLDYLEKIFHIPFHLPPMEERGFATLIEKLTEPATRSVATDRQPVKGEGANPVAPPSPHGGPLAVLELLPAPNVADDAPVIPLPSPTPPSATARAATRVIGSVPLNRWEREALKDYHTLIKTPRGATRLLNTYRLVRAGIPADDWDRFRGGEGGSCEFRVPMLLLAVAAGQPAVARDWFRLLRQQNIAAPLPDQAGEANRSEWDSFRKFYDAASKQVKVPWTRKLLDDWLDRVERFAF